MPVKVLERGTASKVASFALVTTVWEPTLSPCRALGTSMEEVFAVTVWLDYQHCLLHLCVMRERAEQGMWNKAMLRMGVPWEMSHFNQTQCMGERKREQVSGKWKGEGKQHQWISLCFACTRLLTSLTSPYSTIFVCKSTLIQPSAMLVNQHQTSLDQYGNSCK